MPEDGIRRITVFFYGLFMDAALLRAKGINPLELGPASVKDFSLVIGARATLAPSEGQRVHGVAFSLTHEEVDALYSEDSVSSYRPEAVLVELSDGVITPALCFNLPLLPSTSERDETYATRLKEVASRIGLPSDYVSSI